jgi:spoIIIJ-associated protein
MNDCKIIEAKSVEKAIQKATALYDIEQKKLKYEILSHGSSGIFGLVGVKNAKIKVSLPGDKKEKQNRSKNAGNQSVRDLAIMKIDEMAAEIDGIPNSKSEQTEASIEQSAIFGKEIIQTIISKFDDSNTVQYTLKNGRVHYHINGTEVGLLIGKRGKTIEALQYLTEKILFKKEGKRIPISLEVENYLQTKEAKIKKIAEKIAYKVKKEGKPATLGKMNAKERKIVHLLLRKDNRVRTQSIGEGYLKKLVIFPKKGRKNTQTIQKTTPLNE